MSTLEINNANIPIFDYESLTLEKITAAIKVVEKAHKLNFSTIRQFVTEHSSTVISEFNKMKTFESVDQKFQVIDKVFSTMPDYKELNYYILEIAILVS
ncbi:hypothetical protein [Vibrio salinus]|uniref:hypothetical protein n=1 Tax=Vibrio salinus TaxID=2899784 RepID=UPI001E4A3933|nr:hypothetical protein [Vibrio salinus]MCE0495709.1 hypothetical protein [Vibrio salinus]